MKLKFIWNLINSIVIIGLIVFSVFFKKDKKEIVFIDNVKVFKGFNMTSELGRINEKKYESQLQRFDSLVKNFTDLEKEFVKKKELTDKEKEEYANLKRIVLLEDQEIQKIKIAVKDNINKKVWERLNLYVKEYGKKQKIQLILGAQGQGNIMYGDSLKDATKDFLEYANYKYEGN